MRQRKIQVRSKFPRTFNSNEIQSQWQDLREEYRIHQASNHAKVDAVKGDTARFLSEICHLKPFAYQLELAELYKKNQFLAVRWPRQTGKSTSIAGLLLQDAYENPDLNIGFIGPSWRQTKLNLRRVAGFCRNLPQGSCHIQKTRISFKNGSVIEAFPNNPDTIRGNTFNCLPHYVRVLLSNGCQTPISQLTPGQEIMSYNIVTNRLEPKKVTCTFKNPLGNRKIVRLFHEHGSLDCTEDHKIYTLNNSYVCAAHLENNHKVLYMPNSKHNQEFKNPQKSLINGTAQLLHSSVQAGKSTSSEEEIFVYDIEVEDNHNFFADGVLVSNCIWWDETNFTAGDQDLYDAILFTLTTTNGKLIASSTPFNRDSLFWNMCNHKNYADFVKQHFSWEKALDPLGPLYPADD